MAALYDLIASPLQRQVLVMGLIGLAVTYLIAFFIHRFRKSLKIEQVVNVDFGSERIRRCRILRLPADGFSVVVVDLKDESVRFVTRSQIYLH